MFKIELSEEAHTRLLKVSRRLDDWLHTLLDKANSVDNLCISDVRVPASAPAWLCREADRIVELAFLRRALAWPDFPEPEPLPEYMPSANEPRLREGWTFSAYSALRVEKRWVSQFATYSSLGTEGRGVNGAQGQCTQYATEAEARRAGYWAMCRDFAAKLKHADPRMKS